jgi:hypothetical protein
MKVKVQATVPIRCSYFTFIDGHCLYSSHPPCIHADTSKECKPSSMNILVSGVMI